MFSIDMCMYVWIPCLIFSKYKRFIFFISWKESKEEIELSEWTTWKIGIEFCPQAMIEVKAKGELHIIES